MTSLDRVSAMSDPFREKIIEGLKKVTDRDKFERCAMDLLGRIYPRLVALPGGSDGGFDAKLVNKDGKVTQVVCTTNEDVIGNLTGSLEQAKKLALDSHTVMVATNQKLSNQEKRNLAERAKIYGKTLLQVYDLIPVANLIYRDSAWRKDLLNIAGAPSALSLLPLSHRPSFEIPALGRAEETAAFKIETGDLVVAGQPGSGKTHFLRELAEETSGLFAVSTDRGALADAIRDQQPAWIAIDDAGSRLGEVSTLRQLRDEGKYGFRIVAACWPAQVAEVTDALAAAGKPALELEPLMPGTIKEIINAMDIAGPDGLLREMIHQSHGKPGLAVTFCQICWLHGTKQLFTGEALARDVTLSLKKIAGADSVGLLAHLSLAGDAGLTVDEAAAVTSLPPIQVQQMIEVMGAAGVLDMAANKRLSVEPVRLRQVLVRDTFCRESGSLDPKARLARMPVRSQAVLTLVAAGLLGGVVDRDFLQDEIRQLSGTREFKELCRAYAALGVNEARWVMGQFPDMIEDIAEPLLEHMPSEAIAALLRRDLVRPRPLQDRDELKPLRDWINAHAHTMRSVPMRLQILQAVEALYPELKDSPTLVAAADVIMGIEFERTDQPPGEIAAFRLQQGFVPLEALKQMTAFWPRLLPMLHGLSTAQATKLPKLLQDWALPRPWNGGKITAEYLAASQAQAKVMYGDLTRAYADQWTVLDRFSWVAQHLSLPTPTVAGLPAVLFPPYDYTHARDGEHEQAVDALAKEWAANGPQPEIIAEWMRTNRQAAAAGVHHQGLSRRLAWAIAKETKEPGRWLEAMLTEKADVRIVEQFLDKAAESDPAVRRKFIEQYFDHPEYGYSALGEILVFLPDEDPLRQRAKEQIKAHTGLVGGLVLQGRLSEASVRSFLKDYGPEMTAEVVDNLWYANHTKGIPAGLLDAWCAAVVECYEGGEAFDDITRAHPGLAFAWLMRRVNPEPEQALQIRVRLRDPKVQAASVLSVEQRREIIKAFNGDNYDRGLLGALIGNSIDLLKFALGRPETREHCICCIGLPEPFADWRERAVLLLDAGISEEEIWHASEVVGGSWSGPTSRYLAEKRKHFEPLLRDGDPRIASIGKSAVEYLTQQSEKHRASERRGAVRGELV